MVTMVRDAAVQFGEHLAGTGLGEGTARRQFGCINGKGGFLATCQKVKGPNVTMGQIDHDCVITHFAAHKCSNGDRNNKLVAIRKFLKWAEKRKLLRPGFTAADLLDGQKHKREVRKPKLYVPQERFGEMLDIAGEHHPRDRAAVALILYTLERQSELKVHTLSNLHFAEREIDIWREKRDRWTTEGVSLELSEELDRWLDYYSGVKCYASPAQMIEMHPEWLLVPGGRWGNDWRCLEPWKPLREPEKIMHRVLTKMGYTKEQVTGEGCHTGRRSGARALFLNLRDNLGWDGALVKVQGLLDHESQQVTLTYIGRDQERDEFNAWLKQNRMYGPTEPVPQTPAPNVVFFKPRRSA